MSLDAVLEPVEALKEDPWLSSCELWAKHGRQKDSPKEMKRMEVLFREAGANFPPDLEGAGTSPCFWHLPHDSFVQLAGLTERQMLMLVYHFKVKADLLHLEPGAVWMLDVKKSVLFGQKADFSCPTLYPGIRLVVLRRYENHARLSLLAPTEAFALMGLQIRFLFADGLTRLAQELPYARMIDMAGGAFHSPSACAFMFASLMLRPVF